MNNNENHEQIYIRIAEGQDAEALLSIYAPYVLHTAITFEYDVPSIQEFEKRICRTLQKYPWLAAVQNGKILGYAYAAPFHERAAYDWAVETSIYVDQNRRGKGTGRLLYDALEKILARQNIVNLNACIAYPETEDEYLTKDSVGFHRRLGYRLVGEFHQCGYKFNRWYNMVWMEKHIGTHQPSQPPVIPFCEIGDPLSVNSRLNTD
ncbi:MAG: GNAT family N-acetyltransferase [Eubacteriales bacterium]|nr:GNAT family N-acetyltransferase [Eubacteriales bacterium]